eukprot:418550_1
MTTATTRIAVFVFIIAIQTTNATSGMYDRKNPIVQVERVGGHGHTQVTTTRKDGTGELISKFDCGVVGWECHCAFGGDFNSDLWRSKFGLFSNGVGPENCKFLKGKAILAGDGIEGELTVFDIRDGEDRYKLG